MVEARLQQLAERGVAIVDPRQTYVGAEVSLQRVCPGAILHPGTRLLGPRTFVGPAAEIGREGPATIVDAVLGKGVRVDGGYLEGAVLLAGARAGFGAHFRPGTLLEEQASTAHAVGLKHTILLAFVTLGSLVNFCDVLMAGGTSRDDHSEVGSGFIHFNFTPWGARGDKATPSLVGDVVRGVFLREPRIFLGGSAGLVGPASVGYGAVTGAGQVVRRSVPERTVLIEPARAVEYERDLGRLDRAQPRAERNRIYIAQLVALRAWYRQVRRARVPEGDAEGIVVDAAIETIRLCIAERISRLGAFLAERDESPPALQLEVEVPCPLQLDVGPVDHVEWVQSLPDTEVAAGRAWLQSVVDAVFRSP
jgi:UDP-N-acetylglucosamine/UDP-N-acetylgalactosamine diphosphorylase